MIFNFDSITQQNTYTGVDAVDPTNLLCTMTFWHTSSNSSKRFTIPNFSMMAPQWNFFSCESCKTRAVTPLVSSPKHYLSNPVSKAFLSLSILAYSIKTLHEPSKIFVEHALHVTGI